MYNLTNEQKENAVPILLQTKADLENFKKDADPVSLNTIEINGYKAEHSSRVLIPNANGEVRQVLVGLENPPEDPRAMLHLFAGLARSLPGLHYTIKQDDWNELQWEQAALGWALGSYQFDRYKKKKPEKKWAQLCIEGSYNAAAVVNKVDAITLARDLVNTPASDLGPLDLAMRAKELAQDNNAEIEIIEGEVLLARNYPAIHAVGKGSFRPPALIDIKWGDEKHPKLTLVGKGVVFDTGGLNLKPAGGMLHMKKDMGGSAVVLGLAQLIMRSKLPVRLRVLVPAVENSPGNHAYRPGDILKTRAGISVEIGNTDAEGRVVLCDALAEAVSENPDLIIDMATLTGACRVALGQDLPGFYTSSNEIARDMTIAAEEVGDPIWLMPLWQPYRKHLKSGVADISNMADSGLGGSITAALYLYEFVKPFKNWAHFDIFAWRNTDLPGSPKGGEATALRAIFRFLETRYKG